MTWTPAIKCEPREWKILPPNPTPPPPLNVQASDRSRRATLGPRGGITLYSNDLNERAPMLRTHDLRGMITALQSILVLAEAHFGENWGK